jgi:hypothetical protein
MNVTGSYMHSMFSQSELQKVLLYLSLLCSELGFSNTIIS